MKRFTLLVASVLFLAACAGTPGVPAGDGKTKTEDIASARAVARWKSMIAKDLDAAYEFLSPGSKTANPLSIFKAKIKPLEWNAVRALSARCENETCRVKLEISFLYHRIHGDAVTVIEEIWIKDAGKWWYVFNE